MRVDFTQIDFPESMNQMPLTKNCNLIAAFASALLVLTGCTFGVVSKKDPSGLRLGMTKEEVIAQMGKPQSSSASGSEEVLRYNFAHSKVLPIAAGWEEYFLRFVDGKLVSYGPKKEEREDPKK